MQMNKLTNYRKALKMKNLIILPLFLFVVGCQFENPLDYMSEVPYNEDSMVFMTQSSDADIQKMRGDGPGHDSLRHGKMLQKLKEYVSLTDTQFSQVKGFATVLFTDLKAIHVKVKAKEIVRDSARSLVVVARNKFIASVRGILTSDQNVKFEEWITKYWNKNHGFGRRRPGRGHGG